MRKMKENACNNKNQKKNPGFLLSAVSSNSGKTAAACGLMSAFKQEGKRVCACKCGPDYIDPMFHREVLGVDSKNLDLFFSEEDILKEGYLKHTKDADITITEGVMGFYDGMSLDSVKGSSYDVAQTLGLPVILVINARGAAMTLVATVKGIVEFRPDSNIRGILLNRVSAMLYPRLKEMLENELARIGHDEIKIVGYMPENEAFHLESRHLGLVLPGEIEALKEKLNRLAAVLEETLDLDAFCALAEDTEELSIQVPEIPVLEELGKIRLAVAADDAFCFTYQDNLKLLETMGAELVFFSPLQDKKLPEEVDGMILSGGYPELHAKTLSENHSMRDAIRKAIEDGMPCIAECGGFLYLHRELEGQDGVFYPMAGILDAKAYRTDRLGRFGYITLTAEEDQLLGKAGMEIRGHEFHYWDSEQCGKSFHAKKPVGKREWDCVNSSKSLYAGFPHLFFWSNLEAAYEFLKKCEESHGC